MKQELKQGNKNRIGAIGEQIAANYLKKLGYEIITKNYLKKWGEIDLVARGTSTVRFIEVKTVSYETKELLQSAISRGTWRPEEKFNLRKMQKMHRAIATWVEEQKYEGSWEIDVIAVKLVPREKYATVKYLPNVIVD